MSADTANDQTVDPKSSKRLWTLARATFLVIGLLAPVAGLTAIAWPREVSAAQVYCGSVQNHGVVSGVTVRSIIDATADPACWSGSRARLFDHVASPSPYTVLDYIGYEPSIGYRQWNCGVLFASGTPNATNAPWLVILGNWMSSSTCGFQADQNVKFTEGGDTTWEYINW